MGFSKKAVIAGVSSPGELTTPGSGVRLNPSRMFETARVRLRDPVEPIEPGGRKVVYRPRNGPRRAAKKKGWWDRTKRAAGFHSVGGMVGRHPVMQQKSQ